MNAAHFLVYKVVVLVIFLFYLPFKKALPIAFENSIYSRMLLERKLCIITQFSQYLIFKLMKNL